MIGSGEDADAARTDGEADDDEDDAPQVLLAHECNDAGDDEDHCEDPEQEGH